MFASTSAGSDVYTCRTTCPLCFKYSWMIFPGSLRSFSIYRTSKYVDVSTAQRLVSAHANYRLISELQWMYTPRQRDLECHPLMWHCCQTDLDKALPNCYSLGNYANTKQRISHKCRNVNCTIVRNPSTDANASVARFVSGRHGKATFLPSPRRMRLKRRLLIMHSNMACHLYKTATICW